MDLILIFFIFPLVTIILSVVLEYIIKCPTLVAAIFFTVWLLVAYLVFGTAIAIIVGIIYTILSFLTALITKFILCNCHPSCSSCQNFNIENMITAGIQDTVETAVESAFENVIDNLNNNNNDDNNNNNNNNNNNHCSHNSRCFRQYRRFR